MTSQDTWKTMKAYVLCILLVLSLAGCSNAEDEPGTQKPPHTAATGMTEGRDMMDDGGMILKLYRSSGSIRMHS